MFFTRFTLAVLSVSALVAQHKPTDPFVSYDPPNQTPSGAASNTALPLPPVVHICFAGCARGSGMTLPLENGHYVAKDARGVAAAYDVVKFTRSEVVMTRTDYRPVPVKATLTGTITEDGFAITDGKAKFSPTTTNPFMMAWGKAIDTIPGDDHGKPAIVPCDTASQTAPDLAYQYGVQAMQAGSSDNGRCWLQRSADLGFVKAQSSLAVMLYRGMFGMPKDAAAAFALASKAANSGDPLADQTLAVMFETGDGAPKDAAKAEFWKSKSQQDSQQQKAQSANGNIMSLMNRMTPSGVTPWQAIQMVFGAFVSSDSTDYTHYDKECRQGNFEACQTRNDIKNHMISNGTWKDQ
jgi:hypothetical protein